LFDSTKVERFGTHPFVPVERVTGLISDTGVPALIQRAWADAGVTWTLVDPDTGTSPRAAQVRTRAADRPQRARA
jgi:hypothetical protein